MSHLYWHRGKAGECDPKRSIIAVKLIKAFNLSRDLIVLVPLYIDFLNDSLVSTYSPGYAKSLFALMG